MQFKGRITSNEILAVTKKIRIEILADTVDINSLEILRRSGLLDIEIEKHRERRSTDANALLWACLGSIAAAIQSDKWSVYLQMLKRYGKYTYIVVREQAVEGVKRQWRECEVIGEIEINGEKAVQMLCYFGSSLYNTKEFSVLLDGVISEMREMGLETPADQDVRASLEELEKREKQCQKS